MEAKLGGKANEALQLYAPIAKKSSLEWDLNDWRWDSDLLTATPLNPLPVGPQTSACVDRSSSPRDLEKRRREDEEECLILGARAVEGDDVSNGKKSRPAPETSSKPSLVCQVADCGADLSNAKNYHRRHKVCSLHSKASKALVGNIVQRFCQQCSRFHVLQEFDEGKRSCRRRLAGHNKRRRKTYPDPINGSSVDDERSSNYLLISLLRILSNMQSNSSEQTQDSDLLSHLLRSLANAAGTSLETSHNGPELCGPLASTSKLENPSNFQPPSASVGHYAAETRIPSGDTNREFPQSLSDPRSTNPLHLINGLKAKTVAEESTVGRIRFNDIDLNSIYDDSQTHVEVPGSSCLQDRDNRRCVESDLNKSSPPQQSRNSDSTTTQSPSSSSEETQSRTDRIVFKLFGKDPSDLPFDLRSQILNWLSNSPDIESYIRPGCIILTIYMDLDKFAWEELCSNLGSSLNKLSNALNGPFWSTGWVYSRVGNHVAFTYNGDLVLDVPLPLKSSINCGISSIKPIAVPLSERTEFVVKGLNLYRPSTRLLCAYDGKYLVQESCYELMDATDEHDEIQCLRFFCSAPSITGRGFIEVEDDSLSSSLFPFIVAEQEVCSEIRTLESAIESDISEAKDKAMEFVHEMGWLLHRSRFKLRLGHMDPNGALFPFRRFRRLMEFSMDRDWTNLVNKLLRILFEGVVDCGECSSVEVAIEDMRLLHRAVHRNCEPTVQLLLKFAAHKAEAFLFKPDAVGPKGLTPLHVAATQAGSETVLDALTDDPGMVGVKAWKTARDDAGLTPNDYACLRGHYSYINLVHRKAALSNHVVVDIPGSGGDSGKQSLKVTGMEIEKRSTHGDCQACQRQKMAYGHRSSLVYRPAVLSMLAVAAVCVCVALLFKSSPEVLYVFQPFQWERLKYGSS